MDAYSCPLPQLQGIPAIPTHPSVRNFWHAVNVGSPNHAGLLTHVHGVGFPRPVTAGSETMRPIQLLGSHYEITPCVCVCFVACWQLFLLPWLTDHTNRPSVLVQAAVAFSWCFSKADTHTHTLRPLLEVFVTFVSQG